MSFEDLSQTIDNLLDVLDQSSTNHKKVQYLKWVLSESDFELIPQTRITTVAQQITAAVAHKNNLTQIQTYIDGALNQISAPWNQKRPKAESEKIISSLKLTADEAATDIQGKLTAIEKQIENKSGELKALESALDTVKSRLKTESARLDNMVTNEQAALAAKKAKLDEDNAAFLRQKSEDLETALTSKLGAIQGKIDEDVLKVSGELSSALTEAKDDQKRIRDILKITGNETLTKDYSNLAQEQKRPVIFWGTVAFLSFLAIPVSAILMVKFYGLPDEPTIQSLLLRYSLPLSFLLLAIYAARAFAFHRDIQLRAKRTHIRFVTLEPYLEKFSPEERGVIRKKLVDEFFIQKEPEKHKRPIFGWSPKQVIKLIEEIRSSLIP